MRVSLEGAMGIPLRPSKLGILSATFLLSVCLLAFFVASPLPAQVLSGQNRGIVGSVKLKGQATTEQRIEVQLLTSDRRPIQRVFADTLGYFQFLGLGPGVYIVVIEEEGYERLEDQVEIFPRSLTATRRYYTLEPKTAASAPPDTSPVSAQRFRAPKEAREFLEKGEQELRKRRYQSAAEQLDRALSIAPNFADALHARGVVYLQENDLAHAREFFEKAIVSNPQLGDAHIGLGSALTRQGRFEPAIEPLTKGLALSPNSYLGLFERCRAYLNLGRFQEAESDCQRARETAERPHPELLILVGNLHLRMERLPEALREFEAYLRLDANSPTADQVRSMVKSMRDAGVRPPR